jgi:hypothetical protein
MGDARRVRRASLIPHLESMISGPDTLSDPARLSSTF